MEDTFGIPVHDSWTYSSLKLTNIQGNVNVIFHPWPFKPTTLNKQTRHIFKEHDQKAQ